MNLPRLSECCCCCCNNVNCCSDGSNTGNLTESTMPHSTDLCLQSVQEEIYSLPPSKRKRLSAFSALRKTTHRDCLNLVCIFTIALLSFVNVGCSSDISFNSNNFMNGESTPLPFGNQNSPSIPTASSSSFNNVVVPGPSSPTAQMGNTPAPTVTQSYFINGYANQIQKTNVTDLRALVGNKPFQLQFRTVCPFGNIMNDDKFALRFNSLGYLTYLELPQEAQSTRSKNVVSDGRWHSVTFSGAHVFLDDPEDNESYGIIWDTSSENETVNHKLYFFDGFVGCIRLQLPSNGSSSTSENSQSSNTQSSDPFALFKGLQKYQPCNDLQFDLRSSAQCFQPDSFVLCSKCENNATCVFTDGKNECECPESEDESVRYYPPFCSREIESAHVSEPEAIPESRELLHSALDHDETLSSFATGARASNAGQSSSLMSSTTEHMAASSSVEQNMVAPESHVCPCIRGTCVHGDPNRICNCTGTGFRGRLCNNDVCDENPRVCGTYGKCWDDPEREAGFECWCKPGLTGELCNINFDECLSLPCAHNGTCTDGINTYSCQCQTGYFGKHCEKEINECESTPCQHGGTCSDLVADYSCECVLGYDGKDCEINIDECLDSPCKNSGICIDMINTYECNCSNTGFTGVNCEINVDDCASSPCTNGGNCTDGIKNYSCACYSGYQGQDCEIDIPECDETPCKNGADCYEKSHPDVYQHLPALHELEFDFSTAAGYVCMCKPGYTGGNCEIDIDECLETENPCNGHGRCVDGVNEYKCECNKGFEGDYCQVDINECEPNPCEQAKECRDLAGDYYCNCNDGYGGKNCTVALTGCITNICYNEGSCTPVYDEAIDSHSFECSCKSGYTGQTCQTKTTMGFNGSSLAEIVKNDDAFANNKYYLTFQFTTTLPDVVLAVGQGGTYFYLGLSGGKLNLQSSLINNLQGMSSGNGLNDGKWHKVVVSINSTHAILSAGIEQVTLPIAEVEDLPQQPTGFNLTILGGLKSTLGFLNKQDLNPFVGCMQDVRINDDRILPEEMENVNLTNIVSKCERKEQCNPNPCFNKGKCTDWWQKYTCSCSRPHVGAKCESSYIAATFNHEDTPNSLATVDIPSGRFGGVFDISMFVRTREPRGTIFLLCDKDRGLNGSYIEATITKSGNLVVQAKWSGTLDNGADEGIKPEPYTVDGVLSDGTPHLISVQRDKSFVVIKVDNSEHFRKSHSNRQFSPNVMYIGGKPANLPGQELPAIPGLLQDSGLHSGETSTSLPDSPIDNNTEGSANEGDAGVEVFVPEPFRFKGTIQDVRINLNVSEPSQSLGHTSHSRIQSEYIVEFFNLAEIHQQRLSLGKVTIQNLLEGTQSDDHCKSSPCFRGKCNTTWNDFKCDCFEYYDGKQCDIRLRCADISCPDRSTCKNIGYTGFECVADASFDGKGQTTPHYSLKSNSHADLSFSEISFRYRSKRPGNILHMSNGTSSLRISLNGSVGDSSIIFHFMNNLEIQNSTIFDGEWHFVSIKFPSMENPDFTRLTYDRVDTNKFDQNNFMSNSQAYLKDLLLSPNLDIVVGSSLAIDDYGNQDHSHSQYYRGCLRDIYIGNFRLPFITQSKLEEANPNVSNRSFIETTAPTAFYINERFHPSEQHLPRLGCILCYEKDCKNGGICTDPFQSWQCSCLNGYDGETCDNDIDECVDNLCPNGSTCVDAVNNYTCSCRTGFEGWLCEIDIDECEGNGDAKCNYQGSCEDGIGEFKCICYEEYTGTHCDKRKKSNCKDEPCENSAICEEVGLQPNGVSFHCNCGQGWEGQFCSERIDHCLGVDCQNGGTCINTLYGFNCECVSGFDGPHCEVNINECESRPCMNGGVCEDGIDSYTCNCSETGFTGINCMEDVDECAEWPRRCSLPQICKNFIGSYACSCLNESRCGQECDIENPCFQDGNVTCYNGGTCTAECLEDQDPRAVCVCLPEFSGPLCEMQDQLTTEASGNSVDILLIIIPVLAAILIAATVGIIILVRMARRKRATRGVYSPSQQEYCNPRVELDNVMKPPPEERLI